MPLQARRLIRKMRGGAQSHLLEADDGHCYVVKFKNNPQHCRVLVNEMIAGVFLRYLQISTPDMAILKISEEFLAANPEVFIRLGDRRQPVEPGWHFGSRFPGDPNQVAVYDFLPDVLLSKVVNLPEFLGVLAFDKWTANADSRQAIFFRARLKNWTPASEVHPLKMGFLALMLDHGYIFDGPHWTFVDSPLHGLYYRPMVYANVTSWNDFQPWLDRIRYFPEEVVDRACRQVPPEWLAGEEAQLEALVNRLLDRRKRVADLIDDCRRGPANLFPNWK